MRSVDASRHRYPHARGIIIICVRIRTYYRNIIPIHSNNISTHESVRDLCARKMASAVGIKEKKRSARKKKKKTQKYLYGTYVLYEYLLYEYNIRFRGLRDRRARKKSFKVGLFEQSSSSSLLKTVRDLFSFDIRSDFSWPLFHRA